MTTRTKDRASRNGAGAADPLRLQPPDEARKTQVPQMVVAVLLMALFALLAVVFYSRATAREPVVALAVDMTRGQELGPELLRTVEVSTDEALPLIAPADVGALYGQRAIAELAAGTLVTPALFVDNTALEPGESVVGLALTPGEYPSPFLAPGDHVSVVRTVRDSVELSAAIGGVTRSDEDTGNGPPAADFVLVADAVVFDIQQLGTQGQLFVSLRLNVDDAPVVAAAAAAGAVRLVQVPVPEGGGG